MVLASGKVGNVPEMFRESPNIAAFPAVRFLEYLLDDNCVWRETRNESIHITRVERPRIFRKKIVDRDPVFNR